MSAEQQMADVLAVLYFHKESNGWMDYNGSQESVTLLMEKLTATHSASKEREGGGRPLPAIISECLESKGGVVYFVLQGEGDKPDPTTSLPHSPRHQYTSFCPTGCQRQMIGEKEE